MRRPACSLSWASLVAVLSLSMLFGCADSSDRGQRSASSSLSPVANEVANSKKVEPTNADSTNATDNQSQQATSTPTEETDASTPEKKPDKPKRGSIYDEKADAQELIAAAVRRAKRDHKQVLIEWGGNWCGWCHLLHDTFTKVPGVKEIVTEEYELVLIDSATNQELLAQYAGKHRVLGYPHLTVLDSEGKALTNQDTEPLEKGKGHSPESVAKFLKEWMLPKIDAEQLVSEKFQEAKEEDKRVLLRVGNPYCGWCKVLGQFLQDHEELFARDYIDLKIDSLRMTNGEEVAASHRPKDAQGDPWFVILDAAGTVLATSVGQNGNIGYPHQPDEVSHFVKMIRETRKLITDTELASIETDLHDFRIKRAQKLAEQKSK